MYDSIRGTSRYHYDGESRLKEVLFPEDETSGTLLLFDNADNLLWTGRQSVPPQPATVRGNRLYHLQSGRETRHWDYDPYGRRIRQRTGRADPFSHTGQTTPLSERVNSGERHPQHQQYDYDADGQLIRARGYDRDGEPFEAHYHYDVLGRRIRKTVCYGSSNTQHIRHNTTSEFLWHGSRLLREYRRRSKARSVRGQEKPQSAENLQYAQQVRDYEHSLTSPPPGHGRPGRGFIRCIIGSDQRRWKNLYQRGIRRFLYFYSTY